jgi:hypothetical protein
MGDREISSTGSGRAAKRTAQQSAPARRKQKQRAGGRRESRLASFYHAIDTIAELQRPLSKAEIAERLGYSTKTYEQSITPRLRLLPWLKIIRTRDGIRFEIDCELREICASRMSRPELDGFSFATFLRQMRTEIARRKEEEKDERAKAQWTSERVRFKFAFELLEWIEGELDRVLSSCLR